MYTIILNGNCGRKKMNKQKILLTEKDIELLGNIVKINPLDKKGKTIEIIEGPLKVGGKEYLFTQEGK